MNHSPVFSKATFLRTRPEPRTRFAKIVWIVLAIHGLVLLLGILLLGCHDPVSKLARQSSARAPQPKPSSAPDTGNSLSPRTIGATPAGVPGPREYRVASGDTLSIIAEKLNITISALARANPGVARTRLKVGQRLQLPFMGASPASAVQDSDSLASR